MEWKRMLILILMFGYRHEMTMFFPFYCLVLQWCELEWIGVYKFLLYLIIKFNIYLQKYNYILNKNLLDNYKLYHAREEMSDIGVVQMMGMPKIS